MTPQQIERLAQARAESAAAGTRLTAQGLPGGLVAVTEYEPGEAPVAVTMGPDGNYL